MQDIKQLCLSESKRNCLEFHPLLTNRSSHQWTISPTFGKFYRGPKFESIRNEKVFRRTLSKFHQSICSQQVIKVAAAVNIGKQWSQQKLSWLASSNFFVFLLFWKISLLQARRCWSLNGLFLISSALAKPRLPCWPCQFGSCCALFCHCCCFTFPSSQPHYLVTESGVARLQQQWTGIVHTTLLGKQRISPWNNDCAIPLHVFSSAIGVQSEYGLSLSDCPLQHCPLFLFCLHCDNHW